MKLQRNKIKFDVSTFSEMVYARKYDSIRQFAKTAVGLNVNYKTILRGIKTGYISYRTLFRLASVLHCPLGYLQDCGNENEFVAKSMLIGLELRGATKEELWNTKLIFHKYGLIGGPPNG